MSRRKNREKKQKEPELGVIRSINEADSFDSFASVDSGPEPSDLIPKEPEETCSESKEPTSIAAFLSAFTPKDRQTTREVVATEVIKEIESKPDEEKVEEIKEVELKTKDQEDELRTEEETEPKIEELKEEKEVAETREEELREEPRKEPEEERDLEDESKDEAQTVSEPSKPSEQNKQDEQNEPRATREVRDDSILIELRGLTRRYGFGDATSYALKDFDLTIKRGEFIMIMGPSGCGKTTLLNIIGLLDRATSGEYTLNGEDVARISHRRQSRLRAKKIGFIFQNFNLINSLTLIENVALPLVYVGRSKTARLKAASDALKRFHLNEREYYYPSQLSGGQQQRAAIARAIVSDPEIILADEPTGNLDSRSSSIVMDELKQIHEEGNTIIMVTHNPSLTTYATRVIRMLDGQIDTDIKTVADHNLPQPVEIKRRRRRKFRGRREEEI